MSLQSLPTPAIFDELPLSESKVVLETALKLANYDEETKTIYRPLRLQDLPCSFLCYKNTLEKVLPKGEKKNFLQMNYELLYAWLHDGCSCCFASKERVVWDLGDKDLEYFCMDCKHETLFIKHYYYDICSTYNEFLGGINQH